MTVCVCVFFFASMASRISTFVGSLRISLITDVHGS